MTADPREVVGVTYRGCVLRVVLAGVESKEIWIRCTKSATLSHTVPSPFGPVNLSEREGG